MEKINDKIAKISLEADGNIVGESFIIQPDKNLAGKLGVLFGVIEVYNTNDTFLDGFLSAISDLKTEYYLPPFNLERGVEKRFEEAIARANRRIFAAINQSVEEMDLRNISAAIGLFHDNKVYLSSAGRVKGLFYRRKKNHELLIIDILSGNGEARFRPEPEKMFANILSGELSKRDGLLLLNEEFLAVFSQKELGETILTNDAAEAAKIIDESLREKVGKKNYYAVAVGPTAEPAVEMSPEKPIPAPAAPMTAASAEETVSTRPFRDHTASAAAERVGAKQPISVIHTPPTRKAVPPQNSIDRLLITQVRTEKYLTPSLLPQWQKILLVMATAAKKSGLYLLSQFKALSADAMNLIADWKNKSAATAATKRISHPPITPIHPNPAPADKYMSRDMEKAGDTDSDFDQPDEEPANDAPLDPPADPPEILIEEIAMPPEKTPEAASVLSGRINSFINAKIENFLALKKGQKIILVLGLILIFLFSQSIVMIGRASDKPQTSASSNSGLAKQIEDQLNSAEAENIFNNERGAVAAIRKARELLTQIPDKRLNKALRADLQSKIDQTARTLQKINQLDEPVVSGDFSVNSDISQTVGLAKTGKIFWAFDNVSQSLYRLDPAGNKITTVTTSLPQIKNVAAIDDKNLVLLAADKTYYKFDIAKGASSKIKPGKDWFQLKVPANTSVLIDPLLASSTIAMSVASEGYSFFLDGINGRVVAIDKNGILKRQFYSPKFTGASALVAAYKEKKLWVFNAGKAYQADIDF